MPKLRKVTPLDRLIDALEQHMKDCELRLQDLYDLRPRQRKANKKPEYSIHEGPNGKKFKLRVG